MAISRDTAQDCSAANASVTTLDCNLPAATSAGKLLVAVAQMPTTVSNCSVKGGTGFTVAKSQDDFGTACIIGVAKIADGTETKFTFTHTAAAGQIRILGFQYSGALSPLGSDSTAGFALADDGSQHANAVMTGGANTAQADNLVISAASLLGTGTTPLSSNGAIIGNSGGGLFVAERIVSSIATYSDTVSWTTPQFRVGILFVIKAGLVVATTDGWEVCG